jgi:hypothetical protein
VPSSVCAVTSRRRLFGDYNYLPLSGDSHVLDFAVGQEPNERFVVQVDHLDAVAERITEIAAAEVAHPCRLDSIHFEDGEKLMLAKP